MAGILYVIGVGPGDPELITIKGARILQNVKCICVPKGREEGSSLALSIIEKTVKIKEKEIIEAHFPMRKNKILPNPPLLKGGIGGLQGDDLNNKWDETAGKIINRLNKGLDVAFITLGDPSIYSTFFYLYEKIIERNPALKVEIIPGVSSITASACKGKLSLALGDEKIAILPAVYIENITETVEKFDTVVLMKVHKVFNKVISILNEMNLLDKSIYISRLGLSDERIFKSLKEVKEKELDYFSMVIVKK